MAVPQTHDGGQIQPQENSQAPGLNAATHVTFAAAGALASWVWHRSQSFLYSDTIEFKWYNFYDANINFEEKQYTDNDWIEFEDKYIRSFSIERPDFTVFNDSTKLFNLLIDAVYQEAL